MPLPEIELTDREKAVAKEAAKIAIEEVSNQFYQQVGRTVVSKILIWIGILAVGFAVGKGWITFPK